MAEGLRCVEQILENGIIEVQEIIVQQGWDTRQFTVQTNLPFYELESADFESIADTDNPQGIIAVCKIPTETTPQQLSQKNGVLLATDAIQDPGNLGTMVRTACWFDVAGIIFGQGTVDPFHPKVVRSTAGATGVLPFVSGDLSELLDFFEENNRESFLLDAGENSKNIHEIDPPQKSILVIGNEGNGISEELLNSGRNRIKINGNAERVESLNASIACSIALYEFPKH